jgi:sulfur-oxidizing protein SoxB
MVRVGGMTFVCDPTAAMGQRISDMRVKDKPLESAKTYKVAGWAGVSEAARDSGGEAIWDLVARYIRGQKTIRMEPPQWPKLRNLDGNPGAVL